MDTSVTIAICDKSNIPTIVDGLNTYNLAQVPARIPHTWVPIEYQATNAEGKVIGGILGGVGYWAGLEIKILWIDEGYRHQGIGSMLLQKAEAIAVQEGATSALVDTFDFQAKDFYLKNGYTIIGQLDNFPEGHQRFYFSKK